MLCSLCEEEVGDRPDDVVAVVCCICAMYKGHVSVRNMFPPEDVGKQLRRKGWTWKDLSFATHVAYGTIIKYKNSKVACPSAVQKWMNNQNV